LATERRGLAKPIRILIAEDHIIARAGVQAIVNAQPDMVIVAEAGNGEQALALYRKHLPDVTLLDMRMPVMNGVVGSFDIASGVLRCSRGGAQHVRRR